jgi:leucyl aminopeptidase
MEIIVQQGSITDIECDVAVVNLFRGVKFPGGATGAVDKALGGAITKAIAETGFEGKLGETLFLPSNEKVSAKEVLVIGLGPADEFDYKEVEKVSQAAVSASVVKGASKVATIIHGGGIGGLDIIKAAQSIVKGSDEGFKKHGCETGKLIIVEFNPEKAKNVAEAVKM